MSEPDYSIQEGRLLVAAVEEWNGKDSGWVALMPLFDRLNIPHELGNAMVREWKQRGWGEIYWDRALPSFIPKSEGHRMADVWRERMRPQTFEDRIRRVPFGTGAWEIIKLVLAAILGAVAGHYWK